MSKRDDILRLVAENEQDRSCCRDWWREATPADRLQVWEAIQRDYDDPVMEIVSRFAQLAFSEMAEQDAREGKL